MNTPLKHLLFSVFLLLLCSVVYAQMVPITTTIRTPYGPVKTTYYQPMHHQFYYGNTSYRNTNAKYTFHILLKRDSTVISRTKIRYDSIDFLVVKNKKTKEILNVTPSDTHRIFRIDSNGKEISGIAADSCWWFRTARGKISLYIDQPNPLVEYSKAMQVGIDGPIVPITERHVRDAIPSDADKKVQKLIDKKQYIQAILKYNENATQDK